MNFLLSSEPLPIALLKPGLAVGAVVSFRGLVRDHNEGRIVQSLQYEAFSELAVKEGERILSEARAKFRVDEVACVHRVGHLQLGEDAILVEAASGHRQEAFDACRWVVDEVKARVPIWKKEFYTDGESAWLEPSPLGLPFTQEQFYSRQIRLAEVGLAGQERLANSKMLVIGAGGLGCAALPYLAAAGVGTICICDFDLVKAENLSRQVLFAVDEIARPKAEVAAERLARINPFIEVQALIERFSRANALELIAQYDLVLECSDSLTAKFDLNEALVNSGKAGIVAGIYRYEGQLQLIRPNSACLGCLWPKEPTPDCVGTCEQVGVLGMVPGVMGTLQASEAIKYLLGMASPLQEGKVAIFDLVDLSLNLLNASKRPGCTICSVNPEIRSEPLEVIPKNLEEYRVVDIREANELVTDPFPLAGSDWMPLSAWTGEGLDDRPTLFVCRAGVRSLRLTTQLRKEGWTHTYSLPGGIDTLAQLV